MSVDARRITPPTPVQPLDRRRVLSAGLWFLGGTGTGMAIASIPAVAASHPGQIPPPKVLQGKVLADPAPSGSEVSVQIGAAVQRVPYQVPYVPIPGDIVDVSFLETGQGTTPLVLGARSGRSGNLVVNGDFARMVPLKSAAPPPMWAHYRAAGKKDALYSTYRLEWGRPVLAIDSAPELSGDHWAVSAAFPVQSGDLIKGDALVAAMIVGQVTVAVELRISWWADAAASYPAKPVGDSSLMDVSITVRGEWVLEGQAKAPAGANWARVAVRAKHDGAADSQYTLYVGHVYASR
jgi:hypothetical protein